MLGRRNHVERHCSHSALLEHKAFVGDGAGRYQVDRLAEPCVPHKHSGLILKVRKSH